MNAHLRTVQWKSVNRWVLNHRVYILFSTYGLVYTLRLTNYTLRLTNYTRRLTNYTLRLTNYTRRLTYYTRRLTNNTLRLTNYTRRHTNNTRRLTNNTLRLTNVNTIPFTIVEPERNQDVLPIASVTSNVQQHIKVLEGSW